MFFFKPHEGTRVIDVSIHQTNIIITSESLAHNKNGSFRVCFICSSMG